MSDNTALVVLNTGLMLLVGLACWYLKSGMPLWALLFFFSKGKSDET